MDMRLAFILGDAADGTGDESGRGDPCDGKTRGALNRDPGVFTQQPFLQFH